MAKEKQTVKDTKKETVKKPKAPDRMMMFAAEYIIDWNGTRAYKEIYGKEKSDNVAAVCASQLLRNTKVCSEIERLLSATINRRAERRQRVTDALESIAYDENAVDITYDKEGEILEVSRRDRIKCLELLGKMEALFTDVVKTDAQIEIKHTFDPKGI